MLFNTSIAPLLRELEQRSEAECGETATTSPTFIDDVTLAVSGDTWEEAEERGERMMEWAEKWGEDNGVAFEKEKMGWISLGKKDDHGTSKIKL